MTTASSAHDKIKLHFDDNRLVPVLFGEHDKNLSRIETKLGVSLVSHGNIITIEGSKTQVTAACSVLNSLWQWIKNGQVIGIQDVDTVVQMHDDHSIQKFLPFTQQMKGSSVIQTRRGFLVPRTPSQITYLEALQNRELIFGVGPAGTGKTYLSVAYGVFMFLSGLVDRMIVSRPAVEAGERLGFLPGDLKEKIDPYFRPIYDALHDMLPHEQIQKYLSNNTIEIAPLGFMRGRTLKNVFILLDEAQNTTSVQMKMFLTRLGEGTKMVIIGDITQIDRNGEERSGLIKALETLQNVPDIAIVYFSNQHVIRHPLVQQIVSAYIQDDKN